MSPKKKASMNLDDALEIPKEDKQQTQVSKEADDNKSITASKKKDMPKKVPVPLYLHPNLHDALTSIVYLERQQKTNFQKLFLDGLDRTLKERGYPSIKEIEEGTKTIKL